MIRSPDELLSPWQGRASHFADSLVAWYRSNQRNWPWRSKFAEHGDPYVIWVSEIMLQQTTIQAVLPAYLRFLETFPTIYSLAQGTEEQIRLACRGLGYYRRFRMLHDASKELTAGMQDGSQQVPWPKDFKTWKVLPGIGDYTAAAIASIAFGYPKAVVDGNVERVFCRLFNLQVVPDQKWKKVFQVVGDRLIPADAPSDFNQGLMELGQSVCLKQNPKCSLCPVQSFCSANAEGTQNLAPAPKGAMQYEELRIHLFIPIKRGRFGLVQRQSSARFLKGTWSFPSAIETKDKNKVKDRDRDKDRDKEKNRKGDAIDSDSSTWAWETAEVPHQGAQSVGSIKHSITKHKLEVLVSELLCTEDIPGVRWVPEDQIEEQIVSNLDRKALHLYLKRRQRAPLETLFS